MFACQGAGDGPDLMSYLDLVGLATVADVAPLIGVNRAFVRQGLRVMARRERPGIVAYAIWRVWIRPQPPITSGSFWARASTQAGASAGRFGARLLASATPSEAKHWPNDWTP